MHQIILLTGKMLETTDLEQTVDFNIVRIIFIAIAKQCEMN